MDSSSTNLYSDLPSYAEPVDLDTRRRNVQFSGFTNAQKVALVVAVVAAVALTAIAAIFGGPIAGIVVGIATGAVVLGLCASFRARVLDAEIYLIDHPGERTIVLNRWRLFPRPAESRIFWSDRVRYSRISRPAYSYATSDSDRVPVGGRTRAPRHDYATSGSTRSGSAFEDRSRTSRVTVGGGGFGGGGRPAVSGGFGGGGHVPVGRR
jgi:uncharacterized membrane protein YgcG